jgi:short-subunit dehydrogenase
VSVTCVHPGGIKTSILRNGRHFTEEDIAEFERVARATPDRAARIVIAGMKKRKRRLYVGAEARIMAALKLLFPMGSVALLGRLWRRREAASGARQTDGGD